MCENMGCEEVDEEDGESGWDCAEGCEDLYGSGGERGLPSRGVVRQPLPLSPSPSLRLSHPLPPSNKLSTTTTEAQRRGKERLQKIGATEIKEYVRR